MAKKEKDPRYEIVRVMLKKKRITTLQQIFKYIPLTVVARDLHKNNNNFRLLIEKPGKLKLDEVFRLAELFEIDRKKLLALIASSYKPQ